MTLDEAGLGLTLLFELTRVAKSIRERNASYKEGLILCDQLDASLSRLAGSAENIDVLLRRNPGTVPNALLPDFVGTFGAVKEILVRAQSDLSEYYSKALLDEDSSGLLQKLVKKGTRLLRATSLQALLSGARRNSTEAEKKLRHLLTQLCIALKVDEAALKSDQNIRHLFEEFATPMERYRPAFNAPMLPENTHLDFESKNADGKYSAPEANLKSCVFISASPGHVTVARGARRQRPVHGVSGMAGVGKTTALIGLGHDEDIKAHFADGVLFMSLGANATMGHIVTELWKIMSVTGATTKAEAVLSSKSLADAMAIATVWFHGKRILFLIDDIWPAAARPQGYLPDLEALIQGSPGSRMAISTRSLDIAAKNGSPVSFGARDPCGSSSMTIFLAHAMPEVTSIDEHVDVARAVLSLCGGLPIALSVAGAAVALRINSGDDFEDACEAYVKNIHAQLSAHPGASFLDNAIRHSLEALSEDLHGRKGGPLGISEYSLSELYFSLCVLENQQFAPLPVLARMWSLPDVVAEDVCVLFTSMSLCRLSSQVVDGRKQRGLSIHDLHIDFCRANAIRTGEEQAWHRRLLQGHMTQDDFINQISVIDGFNDLRGYNILEYKPRKWWSESISNKGYIRKNLSRHLRGAGLELELGAVLLDIRWLAAQGLTGGVFAVKNDMDILQEAVQDKGKFPETDEPLASITTITNTIFGMGEILQDDIRAISQDIHNILSGLSSTNEWIHQFLERMKQATPTPFLAPTVSLYRHPVEDLKMGIQLQLPDQDDSQYLSTAFSGCDTYCAAGANHDVAVYNLENRSRLKRLRGHKHTVSVVLFSSNAVKIISGSIDKRVIVWDWMDTDSPYLVLEGHESGVSSLSLSGDESRIFSGSLDGSVRVWDMMNGRLLNEIIYGDEVKCISSCPTNELIAVGTRDGYLRCLSTELDECVFECNVGKGAEISSVQFGPDGRVLLCGTSRGAATRWHTSDWENSTTVSVPGAITHVSFHPDGANALLGSAQGEVRHWPVSQSALSKYNLSVARPVNGLSFFNGTRDIIVSVKLGYARSWSGPQTKPSMDFTNFRDNILFDFALSTNGKRVATSTHDGMIRLWDTKDGTQIAEYSAPVEGSHRVALSADAIKIASSSSKGTIIIWNPEMPPSDAEISFVVGDQSAKCLSFSPDRSQLLVGLEHEVQIWSLETETEKLGQIPSFGNLDSSFSADGQFVIVGSQKRTSIWHSTERQKVYDSADPKPQTMSLSETRFLIRTCGPSALRMWPSSFKKTKSGPCSPGQATNLSVDNIFKFVSQLYQPVNFQFSDDVFVLNYCGNLIMYKMSK